MSLLDRDQNRQREHDRKGPPRDEPIAIIGMACRFPGASDISALWQLLEAGRNSVTEARPGSGVSRVDELFSNSSNLGGACRFCAYVDGIEQFDARFFRTSPVEAEMLDPQQRMMLETTWEALEDAAMDPDQLKGSRTGVYTGISNDEYRMLVVESTASVFSWADGRSGLLSSLERRSRRHGGRTRGVRFPSSDSALQLRVRPGAIQGGSAPINV